jgi:glycerophosphoryl diester phosphodiesterase
VELRPTPRLLPGAPVVAGAPIYGPAAPIARHPVDGPLVIAHRGLADTHPENTIGAFDDAIRAGADMVELDVHRTRDGVFVVHHDRRVGGPIGRRIDNSDYHELPLLEDGTRVPTLDEVIGLATGRTRLDVELKGAGYELDVVDRLSQAMGPASFVMKSFDEDSVARIKQERPDVRAGLLRWGVPGTGALRRRLAPDRHLDAAARIGADFVGLQRWMVDDALLDRAAARKMPVLVWTVNDARDIARHMADPRIAGIITDRTDTAVGVRDAALGAVLLGAAAPR